MAQARATTRKRTTASVRALMRRFGISARVGVGFGLVGVMLACVVAGFVAWGASASFSLERAPGADAVETRGALPGGDTSSGGDVAGDGNEAADAANEPAPPREVVVHVDGAVREPGVYRLDGDDLRLADAVERAGGLAEDADTHTINLAAPLEDGTKVYVPREGELEAQTEGSTSPSDGWDTGGAPGLININTATEDELTALSGVGEATARAIVEDRERNGPFEVPEDLMRVTGIGEKKFERVRNDICV